MSEKPLLQVILLCVSLKSHQSFTLLIHIYCSLNLLIFFVQDVLFIVLFEYLITQI